ncbi:hypothetical protein C8N46_11314 [Kordia periserrulae]|uniref:Uncharacterized protein n=1 Tax=Kordia periserrulae TaxID=701523 RepID=A0A2T6BR60_9FLAO|nr:hypothetical protein [Kordia periserrulae]PTX58524.1 hypothetical protein C8N46_11314 [Kordia periserrulae]
MASDFLLWLLTYKLIQTINLKAIVMYIEGISKDVSLISEKRIIELVESD